MVFVEPTSVFKEREGRKMEIVKQRKTERERKREGREERDRLGGKNYIGSRREFEKRRREGG